MPKKNLDVDAKQVKIEFEDETSLTAQLDDFEEGIIIQLALHGLSQKLGDSYAGAKSAAEATNQTPLEYSKSAAARVLEQLKSGAFRASSGGGGGPRVTLLAEAISRAFTAAGREMPVEKAIEIVSDMDDDKKKAARKVPEIAAALNAIKAERAAAKAKEAQAAVEASGGSGLADLLGG